MMGKRIYGAWDEEGDLIQGLTIKQAAQAARENGGRIWQHDTADIADELVETEIDPHDPAYDTKADLRRRLEESQARVASERSFKEKAISQHEEYQKQLIDGGLIPIATLGDILTHYEDHYVGMNYSTTVRLTFQVPQGIRLTLGQVALRALTTYGHNKHKRS